MYVRLAASLAAALIVALTLSQMRHASAEPDAPGQTEKPQVLSPFLSENAHDFVIAGGDGYGATECLGSQGQCGQIVADAWCESKGYARSLAYRLAAKDETTASTGSLIREQAFVITCGLTK